MLSCQICLDGNPIYRCTENLGAFYKRGFGVGGLSQDLLLMEKSELSIFRDLYKQKRLSLLSMLVVQAWSLLKYMRRIIIVRIVSAHNKTMVYLVGWAAIVYCIVLIQETCALSRAPINFRCYSLFYCSRLLQRKRWNRYWVLMNTYFALFADGYQWNRLEPGFVLLGTTLIAIFQDTDIAVRALALVFFFLLAVFIIRGDRNERFFCLAYVLPYSGYSYSMNGLREGLSISILMLAIQAIRKGSAKRIFVAGFPAILIHYSSLLSISYLMITQRPWLRFLSALGMLALLLLSGAVYFLAETFITLKQEAYTPSSGTDASRIIPSLFGFFRVSIILIILLFGKLPTADKVKLIMLGELAIAAACILSNYSFAGVRLYNILSLIIPLSILASYSRLDLNFEKSLKAVLIASSLLGAAGTYRGFVEGAGKSTSFLPYSTWLF